MFNTFKNWFREKFPSEEEIFLQKIGMRKEQFVSLLKKLDVSEDKITKIYQDIMNSRNTINLFDILRTEGLDEASIQNFAGIYTQLSKPSNSQNNLNGGSGSSSGGSSSGGGAI